MKIEDYGLIGDSHTAALVGRNGSIDWLCLPRFDSAACFAALIGEEKHGFWQLSPVGEIREVRRRYRPDTLVLETEFEMKDGSCVRLIDCMPPRNNAPHVVRLIEGAQGRVAMHMRLVVRFDYGSVVPWMIKGAQPGELRGIAGPDAIILRTPVETKGENMATVADFEVAAGEKIPFVMGWHFSHEPPPKPLDAEAEIFAAEEWWRNWAARSAGTGGVWNEAVKRSLITLKALTYAPSGGIVAAPTTSLPEELGGVRNWDYRFCWLRDAAFTLDALLTAGYTEEASAWRDWLLRAVAGDPADLQILYGVLGERRLQEYELSDLPGYENSKPVRVGNAAAGQYQLDVYGEVVDTLFRARSAGLDNDPNGFDWSIPNKLLSFLESHWSKPDEGIWEVRGPRQHFTYSKVMAWVAVDRIIRLAEIFKLPANLNRWKPCARPFIMTYVRTDLMRASAPSPSSMARLRSTPVSYGCR